MSKIYTTPELDIWSSAKVDIAFEAGELVKLYSTVEDEDPLLFMEHDPGHAVLYRVISKLKTVPNGTVVFLLEGYMPKSKKGIISVLLDESKFLCMVGQLRKL